MKKSIKKIIAICLAVITVAVCFAACTSNETGNTNKKYKIGIAQWEAHEALDAATEGFKKAVEDKLGQTMLNLNTILLRVRFQTAQLS